MKPENTKGTFTVEDARRKFALIYHDVITRYGGEVGAISLAVYTVMAMYANHRTGECFPSMDTIAALLKLSRSGVKLAVKRLERAGLIRSISGKRDGKSNHYIILEVGGYAVTTQGEGGYHEATGGHVVTSRVASRKPRTITNSTTPNNNTKDSSDFALEPPEPKDDLHQRMTAYICKKYESVNEVKCPWDAGAAKQLKDALRRMKGWPPEKLKQCVDHLFKSRSALSRNPKQWLPKLEDYLDAPLNQFHIPEGGNHAKANDAISEGRARINQRRSAAAADTGVSHKPEASGERDVPDSARRNEPAGTHIRRPETDTHE